MCDITNNDDVIDSRDVIERIEELREVLEDAHEAQDITLSFDYWLQDEANATAAGVNDEWSEHRKLTELAEQAEGYAADWNHGETLIRDSYFEDYARELAEDCGMVNPNAGWPNNCIDWAQAASELQQDYTAVEFDGVTYWIR
ncbi:hypothetical protein [Pandoraea sputorum]|uniref:hypothetical protein n=1 Tax=Pandoraea sputorum TaxID=93222 RepID=UPI002F3EA7CF